jgi:hypothetical protein
VKDSYLRNHLGASRAAIATRTTLESLVPQAIVLLTYSTVGGRQDQRSLTRRVHAHRLVTNHGKRGLMIAAEDINE